MKMDVTFTLTVAVDVGDDETPRDKATDELELLIESATEGDLDVVDLAYVSHEEEGV